MKYFILASGETALVDDDMFDYFSNPSWTWRLYKRSVIRRTSKRIYNKNGKFKKLKTYSIYMHREIMKPPKDMFVDHINRSVLDNRRVNLRICTTQQNNVNRGHLRNNTSGYKGVSWFSRDNKWVAKTWFNNKQIHLGYFDNKIDAARTVDKKNIELFGQFANLNIPPSSNP